MALFHKQLTITSCGAGGIPDTQECINFCAANKIEPETELVDWTQIDAVYDELSKGSDRVVRFVLDIDKSFRS